jgi:hypothetical protein
LSNCALPVGKDPMKNFFEAPSAGCQAAGSARRKKGKTHEHISSLSFEKTTNST